ncbi:hypothetical protein [Companilactobacillus insicii]|nr:hypothetical protein [Companilactobacillus insicii]
MEEVIRAILDDASINYEEMDSIRQSKVMQRGKFDEKYVMTIKDDNEK